MLNQQRNDDNAFSLVRFFILIRIIMGVLMQNHCFRNQLCTPWEPPRTNAVTFNKSYFAQFSVKDSSITNLPTAVIIQLENKSLDSQQPLANSSNRNTTPSNAHKTREFRALFPKQCTMHFYDLELDFYRSLPVKCKTILSSDILEFCRTMLNIIRGMETK